jgi:hypothetical protein
MARVCRANDPRRIEVRRGPVIYLLLRNDGRGANLPLLQLGSLHEVSRSGGTQKLNRVGIADVPCQYKTLLGMVAVIAGRFHRAYSWSSYCCLTSVSKSLLNCLQPTRGALMLVRSQFLRPVTCPYYTPPSRTRCIFEVWAASVDCVDNQETKRFEPLRSRRRRTSRGHGAYGTVSAPTSEPSAPSPPLEHRTPSSATVTDRPRHYDALRDAARRPQRWDWSAAHPAG